MPSDRSRSALPSPAPSKASATRDRRPAVAVNLALLAGSLAVALLFMEGGARVMASSLGLTSYMQYDALLGWTARPGSTKRHQERSAGFDVTYQINQYGLRGADHDPAARTAKRIVLLGDSNGFGWGIGEGQHLSALLESRLPGVEVVNLALAGYSTDQELLRFRRDGVPYTPSLVILQVTPNDFEDLLHAFANQKPKPRFDLTDAGGLELRNVPVTVEGMKSEEYYRQSLPVPFKPWLEWNSYAYNFLNAQYFTVRRRFASRDDRQAATGTGGISPRSVALFNRLVAELESELRKLGASGLVVHAAPELSANVISTTLPIVDASARFLRSRSEGTEPWFPDGYHWNVTGHGLVADEVVRALKAHRVVE